MPVNCTIAFLLPRHYNRRSYKGGSDQNLAKSRYFYHKDVLVTSKITVFGQIVKCFMHKKSSPLVIYSCPEAFVFKVKRVSLMDTLYAFHSLLQRGIPKEENS